MLIYGKDMTWPDNFLSRFFWTTDVGEIKSVITFNPSGLGLSMKYLTEDERTAFKLYFREYNSFDYISKMIMPNFTPDEVRGLVDSAIRKLHHPRNIKRFISYK